MSDPCVFCEIVAGRAPASVVYEDETVLCFMTLRPTRDGECLVIPREHIDEFTDLPEDLMSHLTAVARNVGRAIRSEYRPDRVGLVVHGYGVPHAHFILLPQHHHLDITSARHFDGEFEAYFNPQRIPELPRADLDEHASRIRDRMALDRAAGAN